MNPEIFSTRVHRPRRFDPILDIGMNFINQSIFSFHVLTGLSPILPMHNTESENTVAFAVDSRTARSVNSVVHFQESSCQSARDIPWISVCSLTTFLSYIEKLSAYLLHRTVVSLFFVADFGLHCKLSK